MFFATVPRKYYNSWTWKKRGLDTYEKYLNNQRFSDDIVLSTEKFTEL